MTQKFLDEKKMNKRGYLYSKDGIGGELDACICGNTKMIYDEYGFTCLQCYRFHSIINEIDDIDFNLINESALNN